MPRKAFETMPFLVPLIFYKKRFMEKKAAKKELLSLRDCIAKFSENILKRFRSEPLLCKRAFKHFKQFDTAVQIVFFALSF